MKSTKGVAQNDTQDDTQDGTQDDTQDVTQGVTQDKELDDLLNEQILSNPQISTGAIAELSNRNSKNIKCQLAKCHISVMWVVAIAVIGRFLTKNKTTVAKCDNGCR